MPKKAKKETVAETPVENDLDAILNEGDDFFAEVENAMQEDNDINLLEMQEEAEDAEIVEVAEEKKPKAKAKAKKAEKAKKSEEPKEAKEPRQSTAGMMPSEALRSMFGDQVGRVIAVTPKMKKLTGKTLETATEQTLADFDACAKKVREKIINVFAHTENGVRLSTYTESAIELLATGDITVDDVKNKYMARPYSAGTSSAQSSQMKQLFGVLGLAVVTGKQMSLLDDSPIFLKISNPQTAEEQQAA